MGIIKPLKRSAHLTPLSRDHHHALLLCWKIRQGIKNNVAHQRISSYLEFCFDHELNDHFDQEERLVFPLMNADDPLIIKAREQHSELKGLVQKITANAETELALLARFADALEEHIRFEERLLFPYVEKNADPDSFDSAGRIIHDLHSNRDPLLWEDAFWIKRSK